MLSTKYDPVELSALEQLQRLGWRHFNGSHFQGGYGVSGTESRNPSTVILEQRLRLALSRLNPWLSRGNILAVIDTILRPDPMAPMQANHEFWQMLVGGLQPHCQTELGQCGRQIRLIDFNNPGNNEFLLVNQFSIQGPQETITPDIVLFVNGLPLAIIETQTSLCTNAMVDGIAHLRSYANCLHPQLQQGAPQLFRTNQLMVCTSNKMARVGTLGAPSENYLEWKDTYPLTPVPGASSQHTLIAGLFGHADFLDVIRNFMFYETVDGQLLKKLARYQQRRAVVKTMLRIKGSGEKKARGGIIWHSQGSGKSLTMAMLANKIHNDTELRDCKVLLLTDRIQLDDQLTAQLQRSRPGSVHRASNISQLGELLSSDGPDLITAIIQKFQDQRHPSPSLLNTSKKIIVLIDEAHRSHHGALAIALNTALPNAIKIAFTATPLIRSEKTRKAFGNYIDTYSIAQAVADGVTCPIFYEGRSAGITVHAASLEWALQSELQSTLLAVNGADAQQLRQQAGMRQALAEAPDRIRLICLDLISHYRSQIQCHGFKAMIVVSSRRAAILYKQMIDALGGPSCATIISAQNGDPVSYLPFTNRLLQKQQISQFKQPLSDQPLAILIVKDMLLTGFDAPLCQVMYLDQILREHGLLQAITRVNRCASGKSRGYIIDYVGLGSHLNTALEMFSAVDTTDTWQAPDSGISLLKKAHISLLRSFRPALLTQHEACVARLNDPAAHQQFVMKFGNFSRCLEQVYPASRAYLHDLALLTKIDHSARQIQTNQQRPLTRLAEPLRDLIGSHITAADLTTIIPAFDLCELTDSQGYANTALPPAIKAHQLEQAMRNYLLIYLDEAPSQYQLLSTKLEQIVQQDASHWARLIVRLQQFRQQYLNVHLPPAELADLSGTEYAFYRILSAALGHPQINQKVSTAVMAEMKVLTKNLVGMLKQATNMVDFFDKQDQIKYARHKIKRAIIGSSFDTIALRQILMDRYMNLARLLFA